jgi:GNAT superfamily N-acetyltransferase
MEFVVLGWPPDGPTLDLDHERFAYAGKFVMSSTGKAVARAGTELVGAVAFSPDRTDADTLRLRYVTVRRDSQGAGIGSRLLRFVADRASEGRYARSVIAVNNPAAYVAAYRAGFAYTAEQTGMAELVLADDVARTQSRYRAGLDAVLERDLPAETRTLAEEKRAGGLPEPVTTPD